MLGALIVIPSLATFLLKWESCRQIGRGGQQVVAGAAVREPAVRNPQTGSAGMVMKSADEGTEDEPLLVLARPGAASLMKVQAGGQWPGRLSMHRAQGGGAELRQPALLVPAHRRLAARCPAR